MATTGSAPNAGLTQWQIEELSKPLDAGRVSKRTKGGTALSYVEGHDCIRVANEVFGFAGWTRTTETMRCVADREWEGKGRSGWLAAYVARTVVSVLTADGWVQSDGWGYGEGIDYNNPGLAHESAVKEAECVPLTTRILTYSRGWLSHDELDVGEYVLAYNTWGGTYEWSPVLAVRRYDAVPVVRIRAERGFDVVCTPDHKWVVQDGDGDHHRVPANELPSKGMLVLGNGVGMQDEEAVELTPEEAAILGWAVCDGCWKRTRWLDGGGECLQVTITQSKDEGIARLTELLGPPNWVGDEHEQTFPSGQTYSCKAPHRWRIPVERAREILANAGVDDETQLPAAVALWSDECRRAALDAMMAADGTERGVFGKKTRPWVMELFRALVALTGNAACPVRMSSVGDVPTQRLKSRPRVTLRILSVEPCGTADVWCPQTEYGTWVMCGENGMVCVTGNTDATKRALVKFGDQFGLALYDKQQEHVDSGGGNGNGGAQPAQRQQRQQPAQQPANLVDDAPPSALRPAGVATPTQVAAINRERKARGVSGAELKRQLAEWGCDDAAQMPEALVAPALRWLQSFALIADADAVAEQ